MSKNKKLKVAMQLVLAVSAAGVATVLHNAPAGAETYTAGIGPDYAPSDFVQGDNIGGKIGREGDATTANLRGATNTDANTAKNIVGTAKAQILEQIMSASVQTLNFGKIVPSQMLGTITIAADGSITNTGGARYVPETGAHKATLSFTGEQDQNIKIEADSTVTITNANGGSTMLVDLTYGTGTTAAGVTTIDTAIDHLGAYSLNYGGTLNVQANQVAGVYTGVYDIFVTYVA
jgi:hypothetical protein